MFLLCDKDGYAIAVNAFDDVAEVKPRELVVKPGGSIVPPYAIDRAAVLCVGDTAGFVDVRIKTKVDVRKYFVPKAANGALQYTTARVLTAANKIIEATAKTAERRRAARRVIQRLQTQNPPPDAPTSFYFLWKGDIIVARTLALAGAPAASGEAHAALREKLLQLPFSVPAPLDKQLYVDALLANGVVNLSQFRRTFTTARIPAQTIARVSGAALDVALLWSFFTDAGDREYDLDTYLNDTLLNVHDLLVAVRKHGASDSVVDPYRVTTTPAATVRRLVGKARVSARAEEMFRLLLADAASGDLSTGSQVFTAGAFLQRGDLTLTADIEHLVVTDGKRRTSMLALNHLTHPTEAELNELRSLAADFRVAVASVYHLIYDEDAPQLLRWIGEVNFIKDPVWS